MPDIVTGKTFVDGEKGITATKLNQIISQAVIQPSFVTGQPASSTLDPTDQLLEVKGAGTYATITGSQLISSVSTSLTPTITAVRLRSFNAVGNPTFEVDQRNIGAAVANPANGSLICDNWSVTKTTATLTYTAQRITPASPVAVPGTSFAITNGYLRLTLNGQQASLAAGDAWSMRQAVEGPRLRELSLDVHSISLLVRSSVSPLNFGVALRDVALTRSLVKLCNYSAGANIWALIQLPNVPVWSAGTTWSMTPGIQGYWIDICLAAGSSGTTPANDTWQTGNFVGALGQDNFASKTVGSTFDLAFIQHEPGATATTPMDLDFVTNLDRCLRYFCKSYDYDLGVGSTTGGGQLGLQQQSTTLGAGPVRYPKPMAKVPTLAAYNPVTGAANSARLIGSTDYTVSSFANPGKNGFLGINTATMPAVSAGATLQVHYTADTLW